MRGVRVRVRLFAQLRDRAGARELELELPDGARVRDALAAEPVTAIAAGLPLVMAVNREYASEDAELSPDDELALVPPVSGGATGAEAAVHSAVVDGPLSLDRVVARVRDPRAGAVVMAPELAPAVRDALAVVDAAVAPFDSGERYLNFVERPGDTRVGFPAAHHARLRAVRERVDPDGVLLANHPIG